MESILLWRWRHEALRRGRHLRLIPSSVGVIVGPVSPSAGALIVGGGHVVVGVLLLIAMVLVLVVVGVSGGAGYGRECVHGGGGLDEVVAVSTATPTGVVVRKTKRLRRAACDG